MSRDLESKARKKLRNANERGYDNAADLYAKSAAAASDDKQDVAEAFYEAAEEENPAVSDTAGSGVGAIIGLLILVFGAAVIATMFAVGIASAIIGSFAAAWWFISFGVLFPEQTPLQTPYWDVLLSVHYLVGLYGAIWFLDRTARSMLMTYLCKLPLIGRGVPSLVRLAVVKAPLSLDDRPTLGELYHGRIGFLDGAMAGMVAGLSVGSFGVFYSALITGASITPADAKQFVIATSAAGGVAGAFAGSLIPDRLIMRTRLLFLWRSLLLSPFTLGLISIYTNMAIEPVVEPPFAVGGGGIVTTLVTIIAVGGYGFVQLFIGEPFVRIARDGMVVLVFGFDSVPASMVEIGLAVAILFTFVSLTFDLHIRFRRLSGLNSDREEASGERNSATNSNGSAGLLEYLS